MVLKLTDVLIALIIVCLAQRRMENTVVYFRLEDEDSSDRLASSIISSCFAAGFFLKGLPKKFKFGSPNKKYLFEAQFQVDVPIPQPKVALWEFLSKGLSYAIMISGLNIRQNVHGLVITAVNNCAFLPGTAPFYLDMNAQGVWDLGLYFESSVIFSVDRALPINQHEDQLKIFVEKHSELHNEVQVIQKRPIDNKLCQKYYTYGKYRDEKEGEWYLWLTEPCVANLTTHCRFKDIPIHGNASPTPLGTAPFTN
uniref:Uncharacterized protein n=1 Tax=Ditylenchus dipsaci TaxID=166011 RepID=A0A915DBG6_9BILA